jgi:hypothetical protein
MKVTTAILRFAKRNLNWYPLHREPILVPFLFSTIELSPRVRLTLTCNAQTVAVGDFVECRLSIIGIIGL